MNKARGFTLIELLVVLAILSVIAGIVAHAAHSAYEQMLATYNTSLNETWGTLPPKEIDE